MAAKLRSNATSFTYDGQYFALLSVDGRLRIWETVSGKLLQEFTPSSHLETTCTCLCWTRKESRKERIKKKKKRRKLEEDEKNNNTDDAKYPNLALGSCNGKLFIYDPTIGSLTQTFTDGHKKTITCVVYNESSNLIYTCSSDCNIVEWNVSSNKLESSWKADSVSVEIIALSPGGDVLLSAGKLIKMWDLQTKDLLQTFNGHSSSVSMLDFTMFKQGTSQLDVDGRYFLSGSTNDRIINVWHVNMEAPAKQAVASYMLTDVPVVMDTCVLAESEEPIRLCVACQDGSIHFFANSLNGQSKKPIRCKKKMMITCENLPESFIKLKLSKDAENELKLDLVSGANFKPKFDTYAYSKIDDLTNIQHESQKNLLMTTSCTTVPKTDIAVQNKDLTKVTNSRTPVASSHNLNHMIQSPSNGIQVTNTANKQENTATETKQLTRKKQRLKNKEEEKIAGGQILGKLVEKQENKRKWAKDLSESGATSAMSFSTMVAQAIHSYDNVLLSKILNNQKLEVIEATVKRLNAPTAGGLFSYMVNEVCVRHEKSYQMLPWLRVLMANNMGYMSANPKAYDSVARLYNFMKAKTDFFPKLHRLEGKIDFLLNQIKQTPKEDRSLTTKMRNSAIVYHEESDDDEIDMRFNMNDDLESSYGGWNPSEDEDEEDPAENANEVTKDISKNEKEDMHQKAVSEIEIDNSDNADDNEVVHEDSDEDDDDDEEEQMDDSSVNNGMGTITPGIKTDADEDGDEDIDEGVETDSGDDITDDET